MLLKCKACNGPLDAGKIDLTTGIATCRFCKAVMRFQELVPFQSVEFSRDDNVPRPEILLPAKFTIDDSNDELRIVRRWYTPVVFFLIPFCIVWNLFLFVWYGAVFAIGAPWIFVVFPLLHVAVGIGLAYFTVACFVNTTIISASRGELTIQHGPLPWWGNRSIDTSRITQIFTKKHITKGEDSTHESFQVHAVTTEGNPLKLLSGLSDAEQALFVEQQLERHLKIEDRPVDGELPR